MTMHSRISLLTLALLASPVGAGVVVEVADRDADGLVAAIHAANQSGAETTIRLAKGGLYTLVTPADEDRELGLPTVTGKITIQGNDSDIRRYSNEDFALVAVAKGGELTLRAVTLAEGSRGAVINHGQLELDHVRVVDNIAKNSPAIVENYGRLRIEASEITYNQLAAAQRD